MDRVHDTGGATLIGEHASLRPIFSSARRTSNAPASLVRSPPSNDASITRRPTLPNFINSEMQSTVQFGIGDSGCCLV
jgi:hypothetical protein